MESSLSDLFLDTRQNDTIYLQKPNDQVSVVYCLHKLNYLFPEILRR